MTREHTGTIKLKSPEGGATKMHNSDLGPLTNKYKVKITHQLFHRMFYLQVRNVANQMMIIQFSLRRIADA